MTKTRLDRNEVLPLLNGFFGLMERGCNGKDMPHSAELDKYVHPDFHMRSNGELRCKSNADLMTFFHNHQQKYVSLKLTEFLEDLVIGGNKVVIRFDIETVDKSKQKHVMHVMAIVTIADNRLLQWSEVIAR